MENEIVTRKCKECREIKELNNINFIKRNDNHTLKYGHYRGKCRICYNKNVRCRQELSKTELQVKKKYREKLLKERPFASIVAAIKSRSKTHNIPFNLTESFIENMYKEQNGLCYYTNEFMNLNIKNDNRASVDRVNPNLGYVQNNVVLCRLIVNTVKNKLSKEELFDFCKKVLNTHDLYNC